MSKQILHTKFGNATLNGDYYIISSRKEGNHGKYLHRLIWEDFYGIHIPKGYVIHHKNNNRMDNCILNLQLMKEIDHIKLHSLDENYGLKNKCHSEETKIKISNARKGKPHSLTHRLNMSKSRGNTGYYRVGIYKTKKVKQGWCYRYQYNDENGKSQSICSIDIDKLKKKVLAKNLEWIEY